MPKEQYMCQLCANHGIFNQPKKGHKAKCAYKLCPCEMCALNTKRRTLDQIERQLRTVTPPIRATTTQSVTPGAQTTAQTAATTTPTIPLEPDERRVVIPNLDLADDNVVGEIERRPTPRQCDKIAGRYHQRQHLRRYSFYSSISDPTRQFSPSTTSIFTSIKFLVENA